MACFVVFAVMQRQSFRGLEFGTLGPIWGGVPVHWLCIIGIYF